jgi:hypothetical protein
VYVSHTVVVVTIAAAGDPVGGSLVGAVGGEAVKICAVDLISFSAKRAAYYHYY